MKIILIGGFLGSGKTTAIVGACRILHAQKKKTAVITNDQGDAQVDSEYVKDQGILHREISNGCFCCKYNELNDKLSELIAASPDVIFAEAVGSCTDLVATVAKPLQKYRPDLDVIIGVFVDAELIAAVIEERASFLSESIKYIFKKQIEEADILIVNKKDRLSTDAHQFVKKFLSAQYPEKTLLLQNSLNISDLEDWIRMCSEFAPTPRASLQIDYDTYGQGERELAWGDYIINIKGQYGQSVTATEYFIGNIFERIQRQHLFIGHLKFFIQTPLESKKISFTAMSTSRNIRLQVSPADRVEIIVNARIQCSPAMLSDIIQSTLSEVRDRYNCKADLNKQSTFTRDIRCPRIVCSMISFPLPLCH